MIETPESSSNLPSWLRDAPALAPALDGFYEQLFSDDAAVARFFAPDYVQHANGGVMDYAQFVAHVSGLRRVTQRIRFTVQTAVTDGVRVAERHLAEIVDREGRATELETFCFFEFRGGLITQVTELYRAIQGEEVLTAILAAHN